MHAFDRITWINLVVKLRSQASRHHKIQHTFLRWLLAVIAITPLMGTAMGCGQKGPLVLPEPEEKHQKTDKPDDTHSNT